MSAHHRVAVGHYKCPNTAGCEEQGIIYRQPDGVMYGVCKRCGPLYWRTREGQEFFLNKGTIWGSAGPPPEIAAELARANKRRKPVAVPAPVAESQSQPPPAPPQASAPKPPLAPAPKPPSASAPPHAPRNWWQW